MKGKKISLKDARESALKFMDDMDKKRIEFAEKEAKELGDYDIDDLPYDMFAIDNKIEPNIKIVVDELIESGFHTFSSCDGGDGHAFKYPTIRISHKKWYEKDSSNTCCIYDLKKYRCLDDFNPPPYDLLKKVYDFIVVKNRYAASVSLIVSSILDNNEICVEPIIEIVFGIDGIRKRTIKYDRW